MPTLTVVTVAAQVLMVLHHVLTDWFDLFPYNNIKGVTPRQHVLSTLVIGFPSGLSIVGFLIGNRWLMGFVIFWGLLLVAECCNWWIPYFFAVYPWEINPETFSKWGFSETHKLLKPFHNHPVVPDSQHLVVMFLTAVSFGTALSAFFQ